MANEVNKNQMAPSMRGMIRIKVVETDAEIPSPLATGRFMMSEESGCLFLGTDNGNVCINDQHEIEQMVTMVEQGLETEALARAEAFQQLTQSLAANRSDDEARATAQAAALTQEATNRQNAVSSEAQLRASGDAALAQVDANEKTAREQGDAGNKALIDQNATADAAEVARAKAAEQANSTAIANNSAGDVVNAQNDAAEKARAQAAEASNAAAIVAEAARAKGTEDANALADSNRATAQVAKDNQQDARDLTIEQRVAVLETQGRIIDIVEAWGVLPLLVANVPQYVTVTFKRAMKDLTYELDGQAVGITVGSVTIVEDTNPSYPRTLTTARMKLTASLTLTALAQFKVTGIKRAS
ncbi:hypothetical protein EON83_17260 [bacterium]|nr:MAG: hypothetical protein EON83_17260 [bacterium]